MSRPRVLLPETVAVQNRFFFCVDILHDKGDIGLYKDFCIEIGCDKSHYYKQKNNPACHFFESGWLTVLVTRYGVSAKWLLTGVGDMFTK